MLTGGHNECNFDRNAGSAMTCGGKREQSSFAVILATSHPRGLTPRVGIWGMTDDNGDMGRNPGKRPAEYELTEEDRQRVRDIMTREDFEEAERARISKRARSWTWYPHNVWDWIIEERVPLQRVRTDDNRAHRLPSLEVSLKRAFAAHVARTAREASRSRERDEEIMALRKENQHLQEQTKVSDWLW
ncbi:hypothetical protein E3N88_12029 [Mikania micrantha]|uniref:Uncharacterized protein n=1 Tax=Mikania micrantha TaxID=192012 RepID=A0A5N6P4C6_9ASTR|nr:hypothetical protein E3N88_12029 [Mikania micrantha]